jgi:threonine dehydrogenase-like Zn-dependent dehydrogenase
MDPALGALVEPGGNALRSVQSAALAPGDRALVLGAGTIGLLAALFARAAGAEVHLMGRSERSLAFARSLGFDDVWTEPQLPGLPWDAVIERNSAENEFFARVIESQKEWARDVVGFMTVPSGTAGRFQLHLSKGLSDGGPDWD